MKNFNNNTSFDNLVNTNHSNIMGQIKITTLGLTALSIISCNRKGDNESEPKNFKPGKYNVLFVSIDDLRTELNCYGNKYIHSPNIDHLAKNSFVFQRAYCQESICNPSRASLMSGLYPTQNGITDNKKNMREENPDVLTLSQHFKRNGYYSYGVGKIYHAPHRYDSLSWSEPQPYLEGHWYFSYVSRENLTFKTHTLTERCDTTDLAYFDGRTTRMAIEKLKELKDTSFFLSVGYFKPHSPFVAPEKYWKYYNQDEISLPKVRKHPEAAPDFAFTDSKKKYRKTWTDIPDKGPITDDMVRKARHGYYACISFIDNQVGQLINTLDSLGLRKNTIIVIWSDHGFKLGDYDEWEKYTNYEIDNRVPLLIYLPGKNGKKVNDIVELVDLYPTLCDMCNLKKPGHLAGNSFLKVFDGQELKEENYAISMCPRGDTLMGYTIKTPKYRLVNWIHLDNNKSIAIELYDHEKDPLETVNVAAKDEYRKTKIRLTKLLDDKLSELNVRRN